MGLFDLFKRPKTEQEEYYDNYDRQAASQTSAFETNTGYFDTSAGFSFTVEDVFTITGRGTVVTGRIALGSVSVGDTVTLKRTDGSTQVVTIIAIEMFRKILQTAKEGDNVGLLLREVTKAGISRGDMLLK